MFELLIKITFTLEWLATTPEKTNKNYAGRAGSEVMHWTKGSRRRKKSMKLGSAQVVKVMKRMMYTPLTFPPSQRGFNQIPPLWEHRSLSGFRLSQATGFISSTSGMESNYLKLHERSIDWRRREGERIRTKESRAAPSRRCTLWWAIDTYRRTFNAAPSIKRSKMTSARNDERAKWLDSMWRITVV